MRKLAAIFVILLSMIVVGCSSTQPRPYFGEYHGDTYSFTLDEDGLNIDYTCPNKWVIFNGVLIVYFFDEDGTEIAQKKFGFTETDSTYVIQTKSSEYILRKDLVREKVETLDSE